MACLQNHIIFAKISIISYEEKKRGGHILCFEPWYKIYSSTFFLGFRNEL